MKFCYEQFDDYIRLDLMPQRGGTMRVDVYTLKLQDGDIAVQADNITEPTHGHRNEFHNASWTKLLLQPGDAAATISYKGQSCSINYDKEKKIYLSGELPVAPYYNGFLTAEEDGFDEYVVIEE